MKPMLIFLVMILSDWHSCEGGIAGLTKFFRSTFPDAWTPLSEMVPKDPHTKELVPYKVDHLCIDMNQIIHSALKMALKGEQKKFMTKIFKDMDKILDNVQPTKNLVLAFDGPAPFAKLQTQRNRRTSSPENSIVIFSVT